MSLELRQVGIVAGREFRDRLRNRWVLAILLVFTAFAFVIAYFGAAQQGAVGFRGIEVTIASLVSLVIYLVPLIALILGFDAIVGERERGTLDLLLSMPLTRFELLLGKFLGLSAALASSTVAGFGLVGLLLAGTFPPGAWFHYAGFILSAVLLGMAFLSLAVAISVFASDRTRASGIAIAAWFFFVLVYDLLLLGALVVTGGGIAADAFPLLLLLNPADVFRLLNIFALEEVRTFYGLTTMFPPRLANPLVLGALMLAWIALPLGLASWKFRR
ncbi:ABC transporter permease [Ramlibacter alkalitolerans]|uniref:ABC transporter permease n=1 Tax=Ramlibacter alkalitolerans TaxID=2039631 RepID=A0ABS1JJ05_9BURK|nr:ABC transporter permease subunit [Ramlibacter alkalitolerans]MBL0424214.1 ABC transporter permease [Ramlibacter alkalitolerans]